MTSLRCPAIHLPLRLPAATAATLIPKCTTSPWPKTPHYQPRVLRRRPSSSKVLRKGFLKNTRRRYKKPPETDDDDDNEDDDDDETEGAEQYPDGEVVPPLPRESLFPGAVVKGKVSSMKRWGVIVDIGSFALGLVRPKELSLPFVRKMLKVAKRKLDIELTVMAVNEERKKIYLTMVPDKPELCYRKDPVDTAIYDFATTSMGSVFNRGRMYEAGVELEGLVKKTTMAGSVVLLRDGGVGFVPTAPRGTVIGTQTIIGPPPLIQGKKVMVKVVGEVGGSLTLGLDPEVVKKAVQVKVDHGYEWDICIHEVLERPPNPFEAAFYRHVEVAHFLNERRRKNPWI